MDLTLSSESPWPNWQKILFRFFFIYFALYITAVPFGFFYNLIIPWIAQNIMGIDNEIGAQNFSSGNLTFSTVQLIVFFLLSIIGTIIWTLFDQKSIHHAQLLYYLRACLRYYVGLYMMIYGFAKLVGGQFGSPTLDHLLQPLGEFTPMGLAWAFMGHSKIYGAFTGLGEVVGGLLLFYRKTTTLGAIIIIAVMANVVMINFCYDVPVKVLSSHLLLMSVFLLSNDLRRFWNFFITNQAFEPIDYPPHFKYSNWNLIRNIVKGLGGLLIVAGLIAFFFLLPKREKPPLYGIYDVESFIQNGDTLAPLTTDSTRWNKMIVNHSQGVSISLMNGASRYYTCTIDTSRQYFEFQIGKDLIKNYPMAYSQFQPSVLILDGILDSDTLNIRMRRFNEKKFRLLKPEPKWNSAMPKTNKKQ